MARDNKRDKHQAQQRMVKAKACPFCKASGCQGRGALPAWWRSNTVYARYRMYCTRLLRRLPCALLGKKEPFDRCKSAPSNACLSRRLTLGGALSHS